MGGIRRSNVIEWYLTQIGDQIESEEELHEKKEVVEKVIDRLTYHDGIIIPLSATGLKDSIEQEDDKEDPYLVVHPNYIIDK